MKKILCKVKGEQYLMNKFTTETDIKSKKQKKVYIPAEEAKRKEYRTKDGILFIPSSQFEATMLKASTDFILNKRKTYKDIVKGGVYVEPLEIPISPQKYEIHECPVVINRARVLAWRPLFRDWSCGFTINISDELIDLPQLKEILIEAGKHKGVGDWRPKYGRFEVVDWKIIEK